jgi:hypothetical protein
MVGLPYANPEEPELKVGRCSFTVSKPVFKAPTFQRLRLVYHTLLSTFDFEFNLRRYIKARMAHLDATAVPNATDVTAVTDATDVTAVTATTGTAVAGAAAKTRGRAYYEVGSAAHCLLIVYRYTLACCLRRHDTSRQSG